MGKRPIIVAIVVIRIGRSRVRAASTIAPNVSLPSLRRWLANSTSRTELDTEMPIISKTPISDWMFNDVLVAHNTPTTPTSPSGAATIMMTGSSQEEN